MAASAETCMDRAKHNFWTLSCILFSMCVIITAVATTITTSLDSTAVTMSAPFNTNAEQVETSATERREVVALKIPGGRIVTLIMPIKFNEGFDKREKHNITRDREELDFGRSLFLLRLQKLSVQLYKKPSVESFSPKVEKTLFKNKRNFSSSTLPLLIVQPSTMPTLEPTRITTPEGPRTAADVSETVAIKQTPPVTTLTTSEGNVTGVGETLVSALRRKRDTRERDSASSWTLLLISSRREIELVTSDLSQRSRQLDTHREYQRYKIPLSRKDEVNKVARNCLSDQFFFLNFFESTIYSFRSSESQYLSIVLPRPSKSVRIVNVAAAFNERVLFWIEIDHHKGAPELFCALLDDDLATLISEKQLVYTLPWHVDNFTIRYIQSSKAILLGMNFANTFLLMQISLPINLASLLDGSAENNELGDEFYNSDGSLLAFGRNLFSLKVAPRGSERYEVSKKLRVRDIINLIDGYVVLVLKESRRFSLLYLVNLNDTITNEVKHEVAGGNKAVENYNSIFLSRVDRLQKHFALSLNDFVYENSTIAMFSLHQIYKNIIAVSAEDVGVVERLIDETYTESGAKSREIRTVYTDAECHRQRRSIANTISLNKSDQHSQGEASRHR